MAVTKTSTGPYAIKCNSANPNITPAQVPDFLKVSIFYLSALFNGLFYTAKAATINKANIMAFILEFKKFIYF